MKRFLSTVLILCLIFPVLAYGQFTDKVRPSYAAGAFYPKNAVQLKEEIGKFLDWARIDLGEDVYGIVAPHAGYVYSGSVAGSVYRQVTGRKYDAVIVISPSHTEYFKGCSVFNGRGYETPLGTAMIDQKLAKELVLKSDLLFLSEKGHIFKDSEKFEHAVEVQIPFIQTVLPGTPVVAVVMGSQDDSCINGLADVLARVVKDKNVLVVASSDLSHFHEYSQANYKDMETVKTLENLDLDNLQEALVSRQFEACGGGPIVAMAKASVKKGADDVIITAYQNSGDVIPAQKNSVVGYAGAVVRKAPADPFVLSKKQKKRLIDAAIASAYQAAEECEKKDFSRTEIYDYLEYPSPLKSWKVSDPAMLKWRGAFVTLKKNGILRGCIGNIVGSRPLIESVARMAMNAAIADPRFKPVKENELINIEFEISVLSPLKLVGDPMKDVIVGKHGLLIQKSGRSGLLLPQVPVEWNWDLPTFLQQVCKKAGLSNTAWKSHDARLFSFTADVFSENEVK